MSKMVQTTFTQEPVILKHLHHVAITHKFLAAGVTANAEGKKIIPAGTVYPLNDATALGVALHDVDVTHGDATSALLIHGYVDVTKIPVAPTAEAKAVLPQISFL